MLPGLTDQTPTPSCNARRAEPVARRASGAWARIHGPVSHNVPRSLLFGALVFVALFLGFRWNTWHVAGDESFATAQKDTEALVIGRLAASRALGFFAKGGLLGLTGERPELLTSDTDALWRYYDPAAQTETFLTGTPFRSFGPYFSHSGLQGSTFAVLDRVLGFVEPATRLEIFFSLTAALVAAVYATLVVVIRRELGTNAALFAFAVVLFSPWLTVLARNLYFSLWLFWLPGLAIGVVLTHCGGRRGEGAWLALVTFLGFLARFLSGYEYITESVALAATPILYYSLRDRAGMRLLLSRTAIAGGAAALALALSLGILALQIAQATGSADRAWQHLEFAIARRAHGDPSRLPAIYGPALQSKTSSVVLFYLADSFDRESQAKPAALRWLLARSHFDLIALVTAAGLWIVARRSSLPPASRARALGLVAATAITLAGALAWLMIFKAHSFIHTHVNPLLWHLGFLLFGAALVGFAIADAVRAGVRVTRISAMRRGP